MFIVVHSKRPTEEVVSDLERRYHWRPELTVTLTSTATKTLAEEHSSLARQLLSSHLSNRQVLVHNQDVPEKVTGLDANGQWLLTRHSTGYRKLPPEFRCLVDRHYLEYYDPTQERYVPYPVPA